jgi:hypothetical protein
MSKSRSVAAIVALFLLSALLASAQSTFTSTITSGNSALSGFPGPYGTVLVTLTSATTATITFTADAGFLFGDSSSADVNLSATSTETFVSATGPNTPPSFVGFGSGNVDGLGTFTSTLDLFDGFTQAASTITFDVTNTSGTWATASAVLTGNNLGNDAAAHIFVCSDPTCAAAAGAGVTGFASEAGNSSANSASSPVPEPGSIMLFGSLLGVVAATLRKRMARSS